ncbi:MAG: hypothetical protein IRZ08_00430 [Frankia sp.]|nr:hypothetical protein [Frankia sp.]
MGQTGPVGGDLPAVLGAIAREWGRVGPLSVRYIHCDVCEAPAPHLAEIQVFSVTASDPTLVGSPPEVVCGVCATVHPRVVGDEPARDTAVICRGRVRRRWPLHRLTRPCAARLTVPATARVITCPTCGTDQPGPAREQRRGPAPRDTAS